MESINSGCLYDHPLNRMTHEYHLQQGEPIFQNQGPECSGRSELNLGVLDLHVFEFNPIIPLEEHLHGVVLLVDPGDE